MRFRQLDISLLAEPEKTDRSTQQTLIPIDTKSTAAICSKRDGIAASALPERIVHNSHHLSNEDRILVCRTRPERVLFKALREPELNFVKTMYLVQVADDGAYLTPYPRRIQIPAPFVLYYSREWNPERAAP